MWYEVSQNGQDVEKVYYAYHAGGHADQIIRKAAGDATYYRTYFLYDKQGRTWMAVKDQWQLDGQTGEPVSAQRTWARESGLMQNTLTLPGPDCRSIDIDVTVGEPIPDATAAAVLGALLAQAMQDGMNAVSLGFAGDCGYLRYHGVTPAGEPASWDMTPPPGFAYPALIRVVFVMTRFEPAARLHGVLAARRGAERISIAVEIRTPIEVVLRW